MESQVDVLTQVVSDCEQSGQRLEKKAVQACQTSIEIDFDQARIAQLEETVRAIARERERLRIELHAGPRISVLQAAQAPEGEIPAARSPR